MLKLNSNVKKIILEVIRVTTSNRGRKCSYDTEHYLDVIFHVLQSDIKWKALEKQLHHDTYRKKFQYWCEQLNVFEIAHSILCKMLNSRFFNHGNLKKLYMDSSDVLNKNGFQCIGRSKKLKFKNATKINIITDEHGFILAIKIVPANKHDVTLIESTIDKMTIKIISSNKYPKYLIADKGYTSKKIKNKIKNKFKLIYPDRKNTVNCAFNSNQKIIRKTLMKTRYINENAFSWMKQCKRLTSRYDRLLSTFTGFVFLQAIKLIAIKLKNMKIDII